MRRKNEAWAHLIPNVPHVRHPGVGLEPARAAAREPVRPVEATSRQPAQVRVLLGNGGGGHRGVSREPHHVLALVPRPGGSGAGRAIVAPTEAIVVSHVPRKKKNQKKHEQTEENPLRSERRELNSHLVLLLGDSDSISKSASSSKDNRPVLTLSEAGLTGLFVSAFN